MKTSKKIFLLFISVCYLSITYSRLFYTLPYHITFSGIEKVSAGKNNVNGVSNFVISRRHLPLTKKLEVSKIYPLLNEKIYQNEEFKLTSIYLYKKVIIINFQNSIYSKIKPLLI